VGGSGVADALASVATEFMHGARTLIVFSAEGRRGEYFPAFGEGSVATLALHML
jgi:hypothetical protein